MPVMLLAEKVVTAGENFCCHPPMSNEKRNRVLQNYPGNMCCAGYDLGMHYLVTMYFAGYHLKTKSRSAPRSAVWRATEPSRLQMSSGIPGIWNMKPQGSLHT